MHWSVSSGWSGRRNRFTTTHAASSRTACRTGRAITRLNRWRGSTLPYTFATSVRRTSDGFCRPGIDCSSGAWPRVSWIASGAASTSVRTADFRSSMPDRNAGSLKKPWSTATSKHRPLAALNRRFRRNCLALAITGKPSTPGILHSGGYLSTPPFPPPT